MILKEGGEVSKKILVFISKAGKVLRYDVIIQNGDRKRLKKYLLSQEACWRYINIHFYSNRLPNNIFDTFDSFRPLFPAQNGQKFKMAPKIGGKFLMAAVMIT